VEVPWDGTEKKCPTVKFDSSIGTCSTNFDGVGVELRL